MNRWQITSLLQQQEPRRRSTAYFFHLVNMYRYQTSFHSIFIHEPMIHNNQLADSSSNYTACVRQRNDCTNTLASKCALWLRRENVCTVCLCPTSCQTSRSTMKFSLSRQEHPPFIYRQRMDAYTWRYWTLSECEVWRRSPAASLGRLGRARPDNYSKIKRLFSNAILMMRIQYKSG